MALLNAGDGGGGGSIGTITMDDLGLSGGSGGSDTSDTDDFGGSGGGGIVMGGTATSTDTDTSDSGGSGGFDPGGTYGTDQYVEDVRDSRDEESAGDPIGTGNTYVQEDGTETFDKEGNVEATDENTTEATYFHEDGSTSGRPLEETLSEGDQVITDTGMGLSDDVSEERSTPVDEASEGYTVNEDVDQTPDRDVYEHGGTQGYEEVSANPSDTAEQDPSLEGSGIVTGSDGTTQSEEPDPSETPVPSPGDSGGSGPSGAAIAAGLVALAAVGMGVGR